MSILMFVLIEMLTKKCKTLTYLARKVRRSDLEHTHESHDNGVGLRSFVPNPANIDSYGVVFFVPGNSIG